MSSVTTRGLLLRSNSGKTYFIEGGISAFEIVDPNDPRIQWIDNRGEGERELGGGASSVRKFNFEGYSIVAERDETGGMVDPMADNQVTDF